MPNIANSKTAAAMKEKVLQCLHCFTVKNTLENFRENHFNDSNCSFLLRAHVKIK